MIAFLCGLFVYVFGVYVLRGYAVWDVLFLFSDFIPTIHGVRVKIGWLTKWIC
jgi:hypothetical protein